MDISEKQLGFDVTCFIGIILKSAKDYPAALKKLDKLDEVVEVYYTTRAVQHLYKGDVQNDRISAGRTYQQDPEY